MRYVLPNQSQALHFAFQANNGNFWLENVLSGYTLDESLYNIAMIGLRLYDEQIPTSYQSRHAFFDIIVSRRKNAARWRIASQLIIVELNKISYKLLPCDSEKVFRFGASWRYRNLPQGDTPPLGNLRKVQITDPATARIGKLAFK